MGMRQQVYVIAKINGRYRCLSALHHQWYFGPPVLDACLEQIRLFQYPDNTSNIRHEIEYAQSLPESFWGGNASSDKSSDGDNSDNDPPKSTSASSEKSAGTNTRVHRVVPFPFISTCHIISTTVSIDDSVSGNGFQILPFNIHFRRIWNDDGITVIDITNLSRVSYCFAAIGDCDAANKKVPLLMPLNAAEYLAEHNAAFGIVEESSCLKKFKSLPVVDSRALKEIWPDGDWKERTTKSDPQLEVAPSLPVTELRTLAFKKVLDEALNGEADSNLTWLASAELLPDFLKEVRQRLYGNPRLLKTSPNAATLLAKVIARDDTVDLSPFPALAPSQLLQILDEANCTALDLAGALNVTPDVLMEILRKNPQLESLNVMRAPNLPLDGLAAAISGSAIRTLSHSQMHSKWFESFNSGEPGDQDTIESSAPALMYGDISPVVQLLYVQAAPSSVRERLPSGGVPLTRIDYRKEHYPPTICPVPMYLGGTFLPVEQVIIGLIDQIILLQIRHWRGRNKAEDICETTAKAFAMAGNVRSRMRDLRRLKHSPPEEEQPAERGGTEPKFHYSVLDSTITALPVLAHSGPRGFFCPLPTHTPKPGQWTIIIIDERLDDHGKWESNPPEMQPLGLRYAFITSKGDKQSTTSPLDVNMTIPVEPRSLPMREEMDEWKPPSYTSKQKAPASSETYQYKDSIVIADLTQFLSMTLPGDENDRIRHKLKFYWNEFLGGLESDLEEKMQWHSKYSEENGRGENVPVVVNKTCVCSPDEVEEALRFFLQAE